MAYTGLTTATITLTGNGDTMTITGGTDGIWLLDGPQGFDIPQIQVSSSNPGGWDGGLWQDARFLERELFIPLHIASTDTVSFRALKTRLMRLLNPPRGQVTVTVTHGNGDVRSIQGYLVSGLDEAWKDSSGIWWQNTGLVIRCYDPAWYGPASAATSATFVVGSGGYFLNPFPTISSSVIGNSGVNTLTNSGQRPGAPVWVVVGPGYNLTITNTDTGQQWGIDGTIAAGEVLTIDCRQGYQTITDAGGVSQWSRASVNSDLWSFPVGVTNLTVLVQGGATAASSVSVSFLQSYDSAGA